MKTLIPGTIADAADVNANFNELAKHIDDTQTVHTHACTTYAGWQSVGNIKSVGPIHVAPVTAKRTSGAFSTSDVASFSILTIPTDCPAPSADACVGSITFGGYTSPLYYEASSRRLVVKAQATFTVDLNMTGHGLAVWVA